MEAAITTCIADVFSLGMILASVACGLDFHELPVVEKERVFYGIGELGEENPYVWNFDMCSVTLGNFKNRKNLLKRLDNELRPLEQFDAAIQTAPESVGTSLRRLLAQCVAFRAIRPGLSP